MDFNVISWKQSLRSLTAFSIFLWAQFIEDGYNIFTVFVAQAIYVVLEGHTERPFCLVFFQLVSQCRWLLQSHWPSGLILSHLLLLADLIKRCGRKFQEERWSDGTPHKVRPRSEAHNCHPAAPWGHQPFLCHIRRGDLDSDLRTLAGVRGQKWEIPGNLEWWIL